jgi:hypothetical protein
MDEIDGHLIVYTVFLVIVNYRGELVARQLNDNLIE